MFFYVVVYNIVLMTVYQKKKKNLNKVNKNGLIKEKEIFFLEICPLYTIF